MTPTTKIIISLVLLVLTIITGIWLSSIGRPLNVAVNTVHKLIALAFTVFTVITIIGLLEKTHVNASILLLIIASLMLIAALFTTGAFLSSDKPTSGFILTIHRVAPGLIVISAAALLYLLFKK